MSVAAEVFHLKQEIKSTREIPLNLTSGNLCCILSRRIKKLMQRTFIKMLNDFLQRFHSKKALRAVDRRRS